jgi:hypothetical protein
MLVLCDYGQTFMVCARICFELTYCAGDMRNGGIVIRQILGAEILISMAAF